MSKKIFQTLLIVAFILSIPRNIFCEQKYSMSIFPKDGPQVSQYLFGNNIEYNYDDEFFAINRELLSNSAGAVTVLRFPGGCLGEYYSWADGVGVLSYRPFGKYGPYYSAKYSNTLGTKEIIDFCKNIGAEPIFTVNVTTGNADMAKAWVAYCNLSVDAGRIDAFKSRAMLQSLRDKKNYADYSLSDFAGLRYFNGDVSAYNVKFWEIGNEIYLSSKISSDMYAAKALEYIEKMRYVSPDIKVGACLSGNDSKWDDVIMKTVSQKLDFVSVHTYDGPGRGSKTLEDRNYEYYTLYQANHNVEAKIRKIKEYLRGYKFKGDIAITEVNVNYGLEHKYDKEQTYNAVKVKSAIYLAGLYNTLIREDIWMANYWNLLTYYDYGFFTEKGATTPPYLIAKIYSNYIGYHLLDCMIDSETFANTVATKSQRKLQDVNCVDGIALSNDGKNKVALILLNRNSEKQFKYSIDLNRFDVDFKQNVKVRMLKDKDGRGMEADNHKDPQNVYIEETEIPINSTTFDFIIEPHSVTSLEISLKEKPTS